jgi:hypothetical protein
LLYGDYDWEDEQNRNIYAPIKLLSINQSINPSSHIPCPPQHHY